MLVIVAQSCPTLCDPMDCSPPGSSVHRDSPGKNTGVDCHALLQRVFPTQGSNQGLPRGGQILHHLSHQKSSRILEWVVYPFSRGTSRPRNQTSLLHCRRILYQLSYGGSPCEAYFSLFVHHLRASSPPSWIQTSVLIKFSSLLKAKQSPILWGEFLPRLSVLPLSLTPLPRPLCKPLAPWAAYRMLGPAFPKTCTPSPALHCQDDFAHHTAEHTGKRKIIPCSRVKMTQDSEVKSLSHVQLFATPWTVAHQAPLSMGFPRQEYWSGQPFPSPGD